MTLSVGRVVMVQLLSRWGGAFRLERAQSLAGCLVPLFPIGADGRTWPPPDAIDVRDFKVLLQALSGQADEFITSPPA